jgi:ribose transport system substrate-binding protein
MKSFALRNNSNLGRAGKRKLATSAITALAVASLLAGCQSAGSGGSDSASSDDLRFIYIAALINDSFFVTQRCGAEDAAKELGVDLKFQGPTTNDAAAEIKAFTAAAATNPDGMIVAPFTNAGWGGSVRPLMESGSPVIATGQTLEPADAMATFITDYLESAKPLVDIIGDISGGEGTMGIIATSTGNKTDSDRYTELVPALKEAHPDLKILDPEYGENSTATSSSIAAALITGNPDLSVIYATSGPQAVGAASAIKAAGVGDKVKLVSFDSSPEQIELLKNDELAATVGQSPYSAASLAVHAIYDYLQEHKGSSEPVPASAEITATPTLLLTPDNVTSDEAMKFQYMTKCDGD